MKRNQTLSMLLMLTASAGLAIAEPEKKQTSDNDLLRGPSVTETNAPRIDKEDRPEIDVEAELKERPMELREVTMALRNLESDRTPVSLGLTQEQRDEIKKITQQYREDIQAFQEANQPEIRRLRDEMNKEAKEMRERRQKDRDAEDAMSEKGDKPREKPQEGKAAQKLRAFMASAPAVKVAMTSIKDVLSEEQYELVQKHVVVARHRAQDRQAERGADRERPNRRGMDATDARPERKSRESGKRNGPAED
jgi:gas vesicle protein